ncbi:sensor histidine kinase [Chryseobacterium sp. IT-36CA2]|uniref:sensor histidine kinase n=1 Tax=Chryseobacterium sp. IT-36CA2 TaxID=3026460 RepID=UPI0039E1CD24
MKKLFAQYGKALFIMTSIVVVTFQGYWLWNNFKNKKKEYLDQTKFEMTQILVNRLVQSLPLSSKKKDSIFGSEKRYYEEIRSINNTRIFTTTTQTVKAKTKTNTKNDSLIFHKKEVDATYKNKMDYILYTEIKSAIPELANENITVYFHENKKLIRTYPIGRAVLKNDTTEPVALLDNKSTYSIHIEHLSRIIIVHKMLWFIIFSVFYIILFLGTMLILFRNLALNQKLLINKEIFTRNMTHELKIPISTLLIAAEGLEKYNIVNEPEGARKYAKSIQKASTQLSFLVETILQNARADNSSEKVDLTEVNLLTLLEEVQEILSGIILKKEAKIIVKNVDNRIHIKGNYDQMKQVFLNLLDNSLKYSEKPPVIIISIKQLNNRLRIRIEDNGIGIPEKHFQEVFKAYFRIPNGDLHDVKGFGLGLSFVKNSLKKQNGNIHFVKPESEGTVVELNLPLYES